MLPNDVLREAAVPIQIATPPSGPYLHRFMTAAITATTELEATAARFRFIPSGEIVRHKKCPESTRNAANPIAIRIGSATIIPDALYGIDYGGKYKFWALEADRGTEPIRGRGRLGSNLEAKIRGYVCVLDNDAHRLAWGIPVLVVRIVTGNTIRAANIEAALKAIVPPHLLSRFHVEALSHWELTFVRKMV